MENGEKNKELREKKIFKYIYILYYIFNYIIRKIIKIYINNLIYLKKNIILK